MIFDAFSSDSIPIHLLTKQALQLYRSKLAAGGVLAFHISNRYLDLKPVLGDLAGNLGFYAIFRGQDISWRGKELGVADSEWMVLAENKAALEGLAETNGWEPVAARKSARLWTDSFSNLLSVFQWK